MYIYCNSMQRIEFSVHRTDSTVYLVLCTKTYANRLFVIERACTVF